MGITRARIAKARNVAVTLYQQDGLVAVTTYFGRFFYRKAPLLWLHMRYARKRKVVAAQVQETRSHGLPQIAFKVTGGIGDYLVVARFIRDMRANVGDFTFDLYASTPAAAEWVFREIPGFRACYADILFERMLPEYEVGFYVCQFVIVFEHVARWGDLRRYPLLARVCANVLKYRRKIDMYVDRHPYTDNALARKAVFTGLTRRDYLHFIAGIPYGGNQIDLPKGPSEFIETLGLSKGGYITVHNGFDTGFIISGQRATKCYPYFNEVIRQVKAKHPNIPIVQVGTTTSDPINDVDVDMIDRTSLTQCAELLRHSRLHIDNESGLVHMATCFGVKSCVVFGPTPADYFGYEGNLNVGPPTCGGCWWIDDTWMDRCPRGLPEPICMTTQNPTTIATIINNELDSGDVRDRIDTIKLSDQALPGE